MNMKRAAAAVLVAGLAGCAGLGGKPDRAEHDPLTAEEHMRLGASYDEQELHSAAAREYSAALRKRKDYLPALMALGNAAFQASNLIEAELFYRKVLRLVPDHTGANNNMAMVLLVRGARFEAAEEHAKTALKNAGPFRPYVLDTLANVYIRLGRLPEAKAALDEAERACGKSNPLLREHLAQSRRQLDGKEKAL
jgi:tetratricopeptide (TPR) repeat protein